MPVNISDILELVETQEAWRSHRTINLIASENAQSPSVRSIQNSDFMARYAEGHPNTADHVKRYYQGTRYIDQIETMARTELLALARCRQADVRPLHPPRIDEARDDEHDEQQTQRNQQPHAACRCRPSAPSPAGRCAPNASTTDR